MNCINYAALFLVICGLHFSLFANDIITIPSNLPVQNNQQKSEMFQLGEELEYSVHYSFFTIGTVRFKITNQEKRRERIIYKAQAIMDSNPSLSWLVDLHIRFYSEIDQDAYTHGWLSEDSSQRGIFYQKMMFDYPRQIMYYQTGKKLPTGEYIPNYNDTIEISDKCQDGLTLFYHARAHSLEKGRKMIPTFINTKPMMTHINFGVEHQEEEIDALDYPLDVIKLNGYANFVGIFGLTGGFEGVFSNDIASIPLTARMKVILGSVRVELRNWKRGGWIPPRSTLK
jgi:hypothetical protein